MIKLRDLCARERQDIIESYRDKLEPMISIGKRYNVKRESIWGLLKRSGINTGKRKLEKVCSCCKKVVLITKCRIRKQKHHFCDKHCYYAWLEVGNGVGKYKASRWGQRVARIKISKIFDLKEGYIVHHEDRNCLNNDMSNLKVFACQGDHVRHHRGFDVTPLWLGRAS